MNSVCAMERELMEPQVERQSECVSTMGGCGGGGAWRSAPLHHSNECTVPPNSNVCVHTLFNGESEPGASIRLPGGVARATRQEAKAQPQPQPQQPALTWPTVDWRERESSMAGDCQLAFASSHIILTMAADTIAVRQDGARFLCATPAAAG